MAAAPNREYDAKRTVAYGMKIRGRAARLAGRTACDVAGDNGKQVLLGK